MRLKSAATSRSLGNRDYRAESTVDFPMGGHVNVLSDYKETGPEIFKILTQALQSCHRYADQIS